MLRRTRLTILVLCILCFFIAAPIIVGYSLGYRFDFEKMKIVATGGIYVRTFPVADLITIDSKTSQKPGMFANSIFSQSLLPKNHTIFIKKEGYYDYLKTLPVLEKQVTKLENVTLFKKNILFEILPEKTKSPFLPQSQTEKFIIKNSSLYYSNAQENTALTASQKAAPLIKNILAFATSGNNIIWLGTDGFLRQFSQANLPIKTTDTPIKLNLDALKINKAGTYEIKTRGSNIFLNNNGPLLILDNQGFSNIADQADNFEISPDGYNLVFLSKNKINLYSISADPSREYLSAKKGVSLYQLSGTIENLLWLNNDYIILVDGGKIIISEIDYRGNINTITLPQTITISAGEKITIKNPQIILQDSKLYIQTGKTILVSEKLVP